MKPYQYVKEACFLFLVGCVIFYFNSMKPKKMNYNFSFSSAYDYSIAPPSNPSTSDTRPTAIFHQYYRVMDSTNIAKRSYYNFERLEKIEVLNHCRSIGLAFVKIESRENRPINNAYKIIPLISLHESLPDIKING